MPDTFTTPHTWANGERVRAPILVREWLNNLGYLKRRVLPIGATRIWLTATPPTGWLICNGQAVSRTTYADLFAKLGTLYGAGDGSTTFNLPNFVNHFPVGRSATKALASTGGSTEVTLLNTNLPPHTHSGPEHVHVITSDQVNVDIEPAGVDFFSPVIMENSSGSVQTTPVSAGATSSTGSNSPVNVVNSYLACHLIIKAL